MIDALLFTKVETAWAIYHFTVHNWKWLVYCTMKQSFLSCVTVCTVDMEILTAWLSASLQFTYDFSSERIVKIALHLPPIRTFCKHLKTVLFSISWGRGAFVTVWFLCAVHKCSYLLTYLLTLILKHHLFSDDGLENKRDTPHRWLSLF